jgi:glycosyltransferase involved in cell wall biosynthesis
MQNKKIIVSVSNDLSNDQRVHRVCTSLSNIGYDVLLCGRRLRNSPAINRNYKTRRFRLIFNKGVLFYACLNLRLFFFYLFNHVDVILANDLDTLVAAGFVSKIKNIKIIYDSHELFTEVPELETSPRKRQIWLKFEQRHIKRVHSSYTVCKSIADFYNKKYDTNMQVIRNLPFKREFPADYQVRPKNLIYQGALNKDRGIDLMISAMQYIDGYNLIVAGKGDLENQLKEHAKDLKLDKRVIFTGNLSFDNLYELTKTARLGFSLEQGDSLNYKYSLPNKVFDYIQAGVPVVCSNLPEMRNIIDKYNCGITISPKNAEELASVINELLNDDYKLISFHKNCEVAAEVLNWENEEKELERIVKYIL